MARAEAHLYDLTLEAGGDARAESTKPGTTQRDIDEAREDLLLVETHAESLPRVHPAGRLRGGRQ